MEIQQFILTATETSNGSLLLWLIGVFCLIWFLGEHRRNKKVKFQGSSNATVIARSGVFVTLILYGYVHSDYVIVVPGVIGLATTTILEILHREK